MTVVTVPATNGGGFPTVVTDLTGEVRKLALPSHGFDYRKLAAWFDGGFSNKRIGWWGDSTTEQMAGVGVVLANGTWLYKANPTLALAGVTQYNHGASGASLAALTSGTPVTNSYGMRCDIQGLAAQAYDAYVICLGINDCRQDPTIIGAYGSSGQVAKALALQVLFVSAVATLRSANPNATIVFRMPNAHTTGTAYITSGVSAQNCMDVYRLVYRGDVSKGVQELTSIVPNSVMYDTLSRWYCDTAYASDPTNRLINTDKLHPGDLFYEQMLADISRLFSDTSDISVSSGADGKKAAANESTLHCSAIRPPYAYSGGSDNYTQIATATCIGTGVNYFDAYFQVPGIYGIVESTAAIWGGAAGSNYGATAVPAIHTDDVVVWYPIGKPSFVMPLRRMADSNQGGYLRWFVGGPDGYYPTSVEIAQGDFGVVLRRKDAGTPILTDWETVSASQAKSSVLAYKYAFSVVSAGSGTLTVRGMQPFNGSSSLVGKTVVATDRLILSGVTPRDGLLLTGATWTPHGSEPGRGTISLAGVYFTNYSIAQGVLLSAT